MAIGRINIGNGGGGTFKVFTGFYPPIKAKEGDLWIKADIIVSKIILENEYKTDSAYDNNTLVIKYTANPQESGYKYLVDIFNRDENMKMDTPFFLAKFKEDGVFKYYLIQIWLNNKWNYFTGQENVSNIITTFRGTGSTGNYTVERAKYNVLGDLVENYTVLPKDAVIDYAVPNVSVLSSALSGDKLIAVRKDDDYNNWTKAVCIVSNDRVVKRLGFGDSESSSVFKVTTDSEYIYVYSYSRFSKYRFNSPYEEVYKIAAGVGTSDTWCFVQTKDYILYSTTIFDKITGSFYTDDSFISIRDEQKAMNSKGEIGSLKFSSTSKIFTLKRYKIINNNGTPKLTLLNTIDIPYPGSTTNFTGLYPNFIFDKDDNLIITYVYKLVKYIYDKNTDTYTYLGEHNEASSQLDAKYLKVDIYNNIYN